MSLSHIGIGATFAGDRVTALLVGACAVTEIVFRDGDMPVLWMN